MASNRTIAALASATLLTLGCETTEQKQDPCADKGQVEMPAETGDRIAYLKLDELTEIDADGTRTTYSDITAHFDDFSNFDPGLTPVVALGPACVGTLGMPVPEGELVSLDVNEVTLSSPTLGRLPMEKDEDGRFIPLSLDTMFPAVGREIAQVDIVSDNTADSFPSVSTELETPYPITDISTEYQGNGSLDVTWRPGNGTYFEITLKTKDPTATTDNRLRCFFLADDGCFTVPVQAMDWVRSGGTTDFTLLMERHTFIVLKVEEDALLQIDAMRSIKLDMGI